MRTLIIILTFFLFVNKGFSQETPLFSKTELVIKFKSSIPENLKKGITKQRFNIKILDSLNEKYNLKKIDVTGNKKEKETFVLKFDTIQDVLNLIIIYSNTELFEYVEPNYKGKGHGLQHTPNDNFFYNRQWSHYNDGTFSLSTSTVDADIDTDLAWDITQGDPNIIVAILDSGAKLNHPEFSGRIWNNANESQNGTDSDGNGYIDDVIAGWDFANNDNNPTDDQGHGTNVTGIALASGDNSIGYAGVNWNSKIMICKILDNNNSGFYTWWADAIYYAVDNGADVINMSVGGNGASSLLEDAINYAFSNNVCVVVSSGNQNSVIQYPAKYTNAFAIGSTNSNDTRTVPFFWSPTSGSNFGAELDFVAPGNYIYGLSYSSNINYNSYWGGTSQAAPHVTGVISLLLSIDPTLTVNQVRTILEESSEDQVGGSEDINGWDQYYGHGRINAFNAVTNPSLSVSQFSDFQNDIIVYPNPLTSNENLTITNITNGNYSIVIYNILGKTIYTLKSKVINSKIEIPMYYLNTSGTYLLKIRNELNGKSINKKIIIE